jgi:hypothetical protein
VRGFRAILICFLRCREDVWASEWCSRLDCKGVIRELSGYIDGDIDRILVQELERHLRHCKNCTLIVEQTKKTIEIFCDSIPLPLSSSLRFRLHAALQKVPPRNPSET